MSDDSGGGVSGKSAARRPIRLMVVIGNAIVGGMETYTRNLIASLSPDEYEVTCVLPYESAYTASLRDLGCSVYITPIQDDPPWRSIELASEVVRQNRIDVIHANLANAHTLAGIVSRMTNTPAVATLHSRTLWIQELSVTRSTGMNLITVCQEAYAQALACGIAPDNLSLIRNGVDTTRFSPSRSGTAFRESIGVEPDTVLVGYVGRLSWEKGPDKFIQAARQISDHCPDVHFTMVGEGPIDGELRQQIEEAGMSERIHMAGLRRDVENVYPALNLMIQTSRSEAMPLALLEAMASGVPVVALSVGGVAEIVECGTTGRLISPGDWPGVSSHYPGDWQGIAAAATDLLGDPDGLVRMGEAARERAVRLYDLRDSVRDTTDLFQRLARPTAKGAGWQPTVVRDKPDPERRIRVKPSAATAEAAPARSGIAALRAAERS